MSNKQVSFANQEIYHAYNQGLEEKITFIDRKDLERFTQILDYYRLENPPARFSFRKRESSKANMPTEPWPLVQILAYCLMPNHFHLLAKQLKDSGVSIFLSKITNSYTKYFNYRYDRKGPLFAGTFKAAHVKNGELTLVSRHIHLNPLLHHIIKDPRKLPYSSYPEYLGMKEGFCQKDEILKEFASPESYEKFVLDRRDYEKKMAKIEKLILEEMTFSAD
ncbi:transposase [Candidatus Microgenomates bacterium]|nr:transposase [Candidatus Microgenomates bacterium]